MSSVSAIVPAYNCEDTIGECIKSLLSLRTDFLKGFEIIVVYDESSKDSTGKVLENFHGIDIIRVNDFTPPQARNYGAKVARGDILFFVDSDTVYDRDFLYYAISRLKDCDVVTGMKRVYKPNSFYKKLKDLDLKVRMEGNYKIFALSTGWLIRKKDFERIGGYREDLEYGVPEDMELFRRMCKFRFSVCFERSARFYEIEKGLFVDLKKFYRMGKSYAKIEPIHQLIRIVTASYLALLPVFAFLSIFYPYFILCFTPFILNFLRIYSKAEVKLSNLPLLMIYKLLSSVLALSLLLGYVSQKFGGVFK